MNVLRPTEETHHHQQYRQSEHQFKTVGARGPEAAEAHGVPHPHEQHDQHQARSKEVHQSDPAQREQNISSQVILRPSRTPRQDPPNIDVELVVDAVEPQSRLSFIDHQSNGDPVSFRPFYTLLKKDKAPTKTPEKHLEKLSEKPSEVLSEKPVEDKNDQSSVEDSSSEETEPTEYLTLATSGSTHEDEKSSLSSPEFGLELVSNIEDNSKLFTLLRIIKDSKLESVKVEDSSSGDDKEVEELTRDKVEDKVEESVAGSLDTEENIFTMTELSEDKGQDLYEELDNFLDGSVGGFGDIMHMFELIEGEETKMPTSGPVDFEPVDQFEYIEVTSHTDGMLKSQRGNVKKSSFSSDLHIIVLSDEEENGQSIGSTDFQNEQNPSDPDEWKSQKSGHEASVKDERERLTNSQDREIQLRKSPTFVSFVEYI